MGKITYYEQKLNLQEIVENETETLSEQSMMICDLTDIIEKYDLWAKTLPRIKPFYAVKCNDEPTIVKLLSQLGCGFDCASKAEIAQVQSYGVTGNEIIFANTNKMKSHLNYARDNGVSTMTFDGEYELLKIKQNFPEAQLLLRIRSDAARVSYRLGEKFGCDPEKEGPELLAVAKKLGLNVIGVSFHVGSPCHEYKAYDRALKSCKGLFEIGIEIGFNMHLVDIGGGFPGYDNSRFLEIAKVINKSLDQYFSMYKNIFVIAEPGRFFVESAQTLLTQVHSKREVWQDGKLSEIMYFVSDGIYGSLSFIYFENKMNQVEAVAFDPEGNSEIMKDTTTYNTTIWGPTCSSADRIAKDVNLPNLKIGTVLGIKNCGAYAIPAASRFNGFIVPKVKFYMNGKDSI